MAHNAKNAASNGNKSYPPEAYDYNDDVNAETVAQIRESRGVDVNNGKWSVIDALGRVVPA